MFELNNVIYDKCKVRIGNLNWDVYLADDANKNLYDEDVNPKEVSCDDGAFGICRKNACKIYISNKLNEGNFIRTIRHEITHAVLYTYGFLADEAQMSEEEICCFMEIHLEEIRVLTNKIVRKLIPKFRELAKEA